MYSQGHLIFIGISLILILFGAAMCRKYKLPIDKLVRPYIRGLLDARNERRTAGE